MNIKDLESKCAESEGMGLDRLVLTMPAPKSWLKGGCPYPARVRTPFGLCEYGGGVSDETMMVIYPTIKQVRNFIEKAKNQVFWRIVIDKEKLTATVIAVKYKDEGNYDEGELSGPRFMTKQEAMECVLWAVNQLKLDQEPSEESGQRNQS